MTDALEVSEVEATNRAFIDRLVTRASEGRLVMNWDATSRYYSLRRADGEPFGSHSSFGDSTPVTGAGVLVYVSRYRKFDRRFRTVYREVAEAVEAASKVARDYGDEDLAGELSFSAYRFRSTENV